MKLLCTSDFHGSLPDPDTLPEADVLIVAGDLGPVHDHSDSVHREWYRVQFSWWIEKVPARYVITTAGNHDLYLAKPGGRKLISYLGRGKHFHLQDESCVIDGVKFYGTPWTPRFGSWQFMKNDEALANKWAAIPEDTDVLIVHGPPYGYVDTTDFYVKTPTSVGSKTLREWVHTHKPKLVVCGHIHEAHGTTQTFNGTVIANVSYVDSYYVPTNPPAIFEV